MTKPSRRYLDGLLAASVAVAEIIGPMKLGEMTDQTWEVINKIQGRLLFLAAAEAERLEKP